jgi:flavin reductase (DIM6/NTAB) family NADH-FMN oxidoreductase RutF
MQIAFAMKQSASPPALAQETADRFLAAMRLAATGVSVVATDGPAGRFGVTVSAISSVSAEPPLVLACINRKSPAVAAIERNRVMSVSLLAEHQRPVAETFAGRPCIGAPYDFGSAKWSSGRTGSPLLSHAAAVFDCEVVAVHEAGSHRIILGRVIAAQGGEASPLVYSRRDYRRIADLGTSIHQKAIT